MDGYRLVYERKVMLDIHLIDPEVPEKVLQEVNREEEMIIKIMIKVKELPCLTKLFRARMKTITPWSKLKFCHQRTTTSYMSTSVKSKTTMR